MSASLPASAEVSTGSLHPRVVLIDVRPDRRALMRNLVELSLGAGTVVAQVATAAEAFAAVARCQADSAVVEIQLPLADGLAAIAALRDGYPHLLVVVCTFHPDADTQRRAIAAGADVYLVKPVGARDLRAALQSGRHAAHADLTASAAV